jgi:hypothetical protein
MCLYPRLAKNKRYTANKKNEGNIPICDDIRKLYVPIGCGKCIECKEQKAREWKIRLLEEVKSDNTGKFVTLSFTDKSLNEIGKEIKGLKGYDLDNEIARIAIRRFLERWRKSTSRSVKHWFVTELGGKNTERIHIHGILFTNNLKLLQEKWQYGNIYIGSYVNESTATYIVKYLHKTDVKHKYYNSKIFTSPGIGSNYLKRTDIKRNVFNGKDTKDNYRSAQGYIMALPIYYRNKLYSDNDREYLWMSKLDKNKRYVLGEEIDVSNGLDEYYKALNFARLKNKRLGFGDDEINWNQRHYENSLRRLGQKIKNK